MTGSSRSIDRATSARCVSRALTALVIPFVALIAHASDAHALTEAEIGRTVPFATAGLYDVIRRLTSDDFEGRNNNTPGSLRTQSYLISRLRRIGPGLDSTRSGDDAYRQPFAEGNVRGTNLLAVIPGRELPDEFVMIGAHYDHLGRRCDSSPGGGNICNGATDNAAGTAVVLAVGNAIKRLPEPPRRSIVLALWDAEEDGLVGSRQYVAHPVVPLAKTVAYVNLDIQGADLLPSLANVSFAVGPETGGAILEEAVRAAVAQEHLGTKPISFIFGQLRSDYASLVGGGVPTVFFSDSTGACYHTTGDDIELVDFRKLRLQSRIAFRVTAGLAEAETTPEFVPPNPAFATFDDAVVLRDVVNTGLADLSRLPADQRDEVVSIATRLRQIVEDGPAAFDTQDVQTLLDAALDTIDLLTTLECPHHRQPVQRLPFFAVLACTEPVPTCG